MSEPRARDSDRRDRDRGTPDRRRGRPTKDSKGSPVTSWVSEDHHDRLIAQSLRDRRSVSAIIRELIAAHFSY